MARVGMGKGKSKDIPGRGKIHARVSVLLGKGRDLTDEIRGPGKALAWGKSEARSTVGVLGVLGGARIRSFLDRQVVGFARGSLGSEICRILFF